MKAKLERFSRSLRPLIASDYDGTLAHIDFEPSQTLPLPRASTAIWRLSRLSGISLAILSGRVPDQLSNLTSGIGPIWRVAEHGTTCHNPEGLPVADWPVHSATPALAEAGQRAHSVATGVPGMALERKSFGVALHTRKVAGPHRERAIAAADSWGRECEAAGLCLIRGREVIEAFQPGIGKLPALRQVIELTSSDFAIYAGDDTTDEDCVRYLASQENGLGVWIRSDERPLPDFVPDCVVDGPNGWAALLEELHALRSGKRA